MNLTHQANMPSEIKRDESKALLSNTINNHRDRQEYKSLETGNYGLGKRYNSSSGFDIARDDD